MRRALGSRGFLPWAEVISRGAWEEVAQNGGRVPIDTHPEVALAAGAPLLFGHKQRGQVKTVGVLLPKRLRLVRGAGLDRALSLTGLRLVGDDLAGEASRDAADAFVEAAAGHLASGAADHVLIEDLDAGSALCDAIHAASAARKIRAYRPRPIAPHWWLELPEQPKAYWQRWNSRSRYKLRSKLRKIENELLVIKRAEDVGQFLSLAHVVSQSSWQGRRLGVRIADRPSERRRLEAWAKIGALRSYVLCHRQTPIAFMRGAMWNGRFVHDEIGYDTSFAKHAPGTMLLLRVLDDLIADGTPMVVDFGAGDAAYKRQFGTRQSASGQVILTRPGPRPALALRVHRAQTWASDRARAGLRHAGLYQAARRRYRR